MGTTNGCPSKSNDACATKPSSRIPKMTAGSYEARRATRRTVARSEGGENVMLETCSGSGWLKTSSFDNLYHPDRMPAYGSTIPLFARIAAQIAADVRTGRLVR